MSEIPTPPPQIQPPEEDGVKPQSNGDGEANKRIARATWQLVVATYLLGAFTLAVATIGIIQAVDTRDAITDQKNSSLDQKGFYTGQLDKMEQQRKTDSLKNRNDSIASDAQISALLRQVGISDSTAKRQLRAYVGFETATALDTNDFTIQLVFVNHGLTPAYHIRNIHAARGGSILKESDFDYSDSNGRHIRVYYDQGVLDPRVATLIPFDGPPLDTDKIDQLKHGNGGVYYYGRITYTDVFGNDDTTGFRIKLRYDRKGKIEIGPAEGRGNYGN